MDSIFNNSCGQDLLDYQDFLLLITSRKKVIL